MIDFSKYPAVKDYLERMKKRPAVAKALAEEFGSTRPCAPKQAAQTSRRSPRLVRNCAGDFGRAPTASLACY
jgi:hypothetical protein